ncbi:MAG: NAD-dependent epimerase/dehydratase family protein [Candidatus Daviesbacteria bacterium]|nr:NAD-dependent epimerase/dehydratase family protein [Candidatus Daviesbacteria bacterium]
MKKRILITGGTGFIGSALVRALVNNGESVKVLDNQSRGSMRRLNGFEGKFEMIEGDIRDPKVVERACKGVDLVLHLAYINGTEFFYIKPELILEVGVKGMMNVLDGCMKHHVPELLLVSSSEVYQTPPIIPTPENVPLVVPDPLNPRYSYGGGKIISELLVLNYGRKFFKRVLIVRPHNVYGPDMGWEHVIPQLALRIKKLAENKSSRKINLPIQGSGKETRAFCYIDDFTNGILKVLDKGKHLEIYNIGTMKETSSKELAEEIGACFNIAINIVPGKLNKGSTLRRCPDTTKLQKLGFKSSYSLRMGLQKTVQWYNSSAHLQFKND